MCIHQSYLKQFVAISFLVLFLFSSTELRQFAKIPDLISHFISHEEDHEERITDFLAEHYGNGGTEKSHHPSSDKQHGDLPFKVISHVLVNVFNIQELNISIPEKQLIAIDEDSNPIIWKNSYCSLEDQDIFQPPKI